MTTDQNFPNRPDHPDFWEMVRAVNALDNLSENNSVDEISDAHDVDFDSVVYMANQRAMRAAEQFPATDDPSLHQAQFGANWIDGFMAGLHVGHVHEAQKILDGNRRQGA